ncbi:ABC transporter ATP-binding protein [Methanocaldococcus sp.]
MNDLLVVKDLRVNFLLDDVKVKAVNGAYISIKKGETLCLIGESGSGKSVLGLSILKLLPENTEISGEILFEGKNLLELSDKEIRKIRGGKISWVPQSPSTSLNPVLKVGYQIAEPILLHLNLSKKEVYEKVISLLDYFGIHPPEKRYHEYPHQYSGGMRQRALVAMGTSTKPKLIIADEPTKGIDILKKVRVIKLFERIKNHYKGISLLLITHDLTLAKKLADKIAVMYCGQVIEISKTEDFFKNPLHPYSKALLDSLPSRGLKPIKGYSPSMINPPKGCKFHPRCEFFSNRCLTEPPFFNVDGNLVRCYLYDRG